MKKLNSTEIAALARTLYKEKQITITQEERNKHKEDWVKEAKKHKTQVTKDFDKSAIGKLYNKLALLDERLVHVVTKDTVIYNRTEKKYQYYSGYNSENRVFTIEEIKDHIILASIEAKDLVELKKIVNKALKP